MMMTSVISTTRRVGTVVGRVSHHTSRRSAVFAQVCSADGVQRNAGDAEIHTAWPSTMTIIIVQIDHDVVTASLKEISPLKRRKINSQRIRRVPGHRKSDASIMVSGLAPAKTVPGAWYSYAALAETKE